MIILCIVFYFGRNANNYQKKVLDIMQELKSRNIIISSFINDNLRCQISALKFYSDECLQKISDDPYVQAIEWISCCCHTTALGFDDMTTSIKTLSDQNKLSFWFRFFCQFFQNKNGCCKNKYHLSILLPHQNHDFISC